MRVHVAPPLAKYSRLKVFFRGIYSILAFIIRYALQIVLELVSIVSWFTIVITGRQPAALQDALRFALSYIVRTDALLFLITETYPTISDS